MFFICAYKYTIAYGNHGQCAVSAEEAAAESGKLLKRADIILALDICEGRKPAKEADSAGHSGVGRQTIQNGKKDFVVAAGITTCLQRKKWEPPPVPAKRTEARIIAVACGQPPQGYPTGN
jgi:hypothetical protein